MSKYEFYVPDNVNTNSTHGKILSKLKPGSEILECGCASGYMTRYLKEKMGCAVDVVEIDEKTIEIAKQWARGAYCGSLDNDIWCNHFGLNRYDYILFADVLEHLKDPRSALANAATLLKDSGKIVVSIPNICHNDILVRMFYDEWDYTSIGLLDNTHIHFWGGKNLGQSFMSAGLKIIDVDAHMAGTQTTEQRYPGEIDPDLLNLLKKRDYGEVYQYIIVSEKAV